jgi:16S rRNA G966 N2-methylase RsmD
MDAKNKLYFGDNLKILREYVPEASVDLIYLDPPFNSSATYNVLFKEKSGEESAAQIMVSSVAPIYDRRLWAEKEAAVIDRRYSGRAGNRRRFTGKSSRAARANLPT